MVLRCRQLDERERQRGEALQREREARAAGFTAHLVKPVDPDRLLEMLGRPFERPSAAGSFDRRSN